MPTLPELLAPAWLPYTVGGAVLLAATGWFALRRRRGSLEPTCRKCGYGVLGLGGRTCPECGSDLDAVGVRPPEPVRTFPVWLRIPAWTAFVGLLSAGLTGSTADLAPGWWEGRGKTTLKYPDSGGYVGVYLTGRYERYSWGFPGSTDFGDLTLTLPDGRERTLDYDNRVGRCTARFRGGGADTTWNAPLSAEVVAEWMELAGAGSRADVAAEAAEVFAETAERFGDRSGDGAGGHFRKRLIGARKGTVFHPPSWFWPLYVGGWGAIWVGGLAEILRTWLTVRPRRARPLQLAAALRPPPTAPPADPSGTPTPPPPANPPTGPTPP